MSTTGGFEPRPAIFLQAAAPVRTGMAIASMVLGILGLITCFGAVALGPIAIILGIIAVVRASNRPTEYGGKGFAITGICTGSACLLVILPFLLAILLPSLSRARELAKRLVDAANLKGIGTACSIYAVGNANQYPTDLGTLIALGGMTSKQLQDPSDDDSTNACDYSFVLGLTSKDPPTWIVAFCDPAYHDNEGGNILYVDGHVAFEKEPRFSEVMAKFREDYQAKRGSLPTILAPARSSP